MSSVMTEVIVEDDNTLSVLHKCYNTCKYWAIPKNAQPRINARHALIKLSNPCDASLSQTQIAFKMACQRCTA
jgi:hypothetical protein